MPAHVQQIAAPGQRAYMCHGTVTFAHCLWAIASPCLAWIDMAALDADAPPWTPRHQHCSDLLHEDFVGIDEDIENLNPKLPQYDSFWLNME